jgi:hypothetical protein
MTASASVAGTTVGVEAEEMWAAIQKLQSALKDSGFNPR